MQYCTAHSSPFESRRSIPLEIATIDDMATTSFCRRISPFSSPFSFSPSAVSWLRHRLLPPSSQGAWPVFSPASELRPLWSSHGKLLFCSGLFGFGSRGFGLDGRGLGFGRFRSASSLTLLVRIVCLAEIRRFFVGYRSSGHHEVILVQLDMAIIGYLPLLLGNGTSTLLSGNHHAGYCPFAIFAARFGPEDPYFCRSVRTVIEPGASRHHPIVNGQVEEVILVFSHLGLSPKVIENNLPVPTFIHTLTYLNASFRWLGDGLIQSRNDLSLTDAEVAHATLLHDDAEIVEPVGLNHDRFTSIHNLQHPLQPVHDGKLHQQPITGEILPEG